MKVSESQRFRLICVLCVLALTACGRQKGSSAVATSKSPVMSPSDVVRSAMTAANAGRYSKVEEHSSKQLKEAESTGVYAGLGGTKGVWDWCTRGRTIVDLRILNEDVRGEAAGVAVSRHIQGETEPRLLYFQLVKEDGTWKVADFGEEGRFPELLKYR